MIDPDFYETNYLVAAKRHCYYIRLSSFREALGNKAVKRPLRPELFQMDVLGAN